MAWRYAHLPIFAAVAAVGAGLRVAAAAVEDEELSALDIALALAVPVALLLTLVFVTWSVLMRAHDLSHVPLFVLSLLPVVAAVVVAAVRGGDEPLSLDAPGALTTLAAVVGLVALGAVVEVVGHEVVGYSHTMRAISGDRAVAR